MLGGLIAKLGLNLLFGRIGSFLKAVPRPVWIAFAVIAVLGLAYWLHERKADAALTASYNEGFRASNDSWQKRFNDMKAEADRWRQEAEATQARISQEEQLRHEAESRATASRADALRVRGPGQAAACTGRLSDPGVSAAPGQPQPPSGPSNGSGAGVPVDDRQAIVPWGWLVGRAEQCDVNRSEVETWRRWYEREAAANSELRLRGRVNQ